MTRSKSRRTRRNRRRRGGKKKPIAPNTPPFAGAEGWITANNHLTDLTTPGGCAMMLEKEEHYMVGLVGVANTVKLLHPR